MEIEKNHKKGIVPSIFICFAIMLVAFAVRVPADVSPYFAEMDSYYYLRLTENIVDHGYAGDEIRDGKNWDTHSCAPEGRVVDTTIGICYLTIVFWRVLNLFFSCSIMTAAYWMGAVLSVFVVIPVYLLARLITNLYGATVAAALVAVGSGYVLHTYPGFYDTDLFNLTIPLTAIVLLIYAISTTNKGKRIILSLASASLIAVFSICWTGYSFYFVMLIIYLVMISILALLQKKNFQKQTELQNRKNVEINIGFNIGINLFIIICMITFVLLLRGPEMFISIYQKLMSVFHFQDQAQSGVSYGNVYQSVAELQPPALLAGGISGLFNTFAASVGSNTGNTLGIINGVGGILSAVCACGAIGTCVYKFVKHGKQYDKQHDKQRNKQHNKEQEPILDFQNEYILLLLWTILSAVAAVKAQRFVVILSVPIAILAGSFVGNSIKKIKQVWIKCVMVGIIILPCVLSAYHYCSTVTSPLTDDTAEAMEYIKETTPTNEKLVSWWDLGYYYEWKADRATVFDGGSQGLDDGAQAKRVAEFLCSAQEEKAAKLFDEWGGSLVLTKDMVDKMYWISYYGNYGENGSNGYICLQSDEKFQLNENSAIDITLYSGQGGKVKAVVTRGQNQDYTAYTETLAFDNRILYNENQRYNPYRIDQIIWTDGEEVQKTSLSTEAQNYGYSLLLRQYTDGTRAVLMSNDMMESMFTKLYFMNGKDQTTFLKTYGSEEGTQIWVKGENKSGGKQ